jgi:Zn-finger nucleic acid-binding protein
MDCPRCTLALSAQKYEKEVVHFCGSCWGCWVEQPRLKKILDNEMYQFSHGEKKTIFKTWAEKGDANRQGSEDQVVNCPVCSTAMARETFAEDCPVTVDRCEKHGVWLDTGELKEIQIFVESRKSPPRKKK